MVGGLRPRRKTGPVVEDGSREAIPLRFARKLRHRLTASEYKLWQALRRNQIHSVHFRRQHPIGPYVADFICLRLKLIVEVDGISHLTAEQISHDARRSRFLNPEGYNVIRFWNLDVLTNLEYVVERIAEEVKFRTRNSPSNEVGGG